MSATSQKDPQVFEHFTSSLGEDASEETLRLLEYIVFDEDGDYRDVMTTSKTFINRQLAALYDVPAPSAEEFSYVDLEDYSPRVGLLGHASILGLNAHAVSSSPTLRGKAVRNILLCQLIPAPPVNVDTSIPEPSGTTNTMRERVAEHLTDPSCAGCHRLTDPIGLGLENFDGIGRWRDYDNGEIIDPSGDLDGAEFVTPYELGDAIRNHRQFVPCVVRTLNRYATGRMETSEERAWLETLVERFEGHKYSFRALALEIVMSPFFVKAGTEGGGTMNPMSRRKFLRGMMATSAVTVALPALEAFTNTTGTAYASGNAFPKRYGLFYWGNGVHPDLWIPTRTGTEWELSPQLAPFANVKSSLSVLTGLEVKLPNLIAHSSGPCGLLSGGPLAGSNRDGDDDFPIFELPSLDRIIANEIGNDTRFRSVEVAVEPGAKGLSYNSAESLNPPEANPVEIFNRLLVPAFEHLERNQSSTRSLHFDVAFSMPCWEMPISFVSVLVWPTKLDSTNTSPVFVN